jgi:ferredoxin
LSDASVKVAVPQPSPEGRFENSLIAPPIELRPASHLEYFSVPEVPDYVNHPFRLRLARSGREIAVTAGQSATDALAAAGVHVDVKCSDGLCGVCKCGVLSGAVEHRDFVLSKTQRGAALILCQSRAAEPGGVIEIDL